MKQELLNLTFEELGQFVADLGEKPYRTSQIWQWLWHKNARSFSDMTNISKPTRELLAENARITWPEIAAHQTGGDGTQKLLLRLSDGALIETVLIPAYSKEGQLRITQCLSCQVGCVMECTFCSTGNLGFTRNMTQAEILGQVLVARHLLREKPHQPLLRNMVFMGMGEPLLNQSELMRSLRTMNDCQGLAFSPRRITVSTCGIQKGLRELGESNLAFLAVSLHAPNQALRAKIMPKAARWPLEALMQELRTYPLHTRERMTFEYLLLGGVNDSITHAQELVRLLSRIKSKVNIIIYNPAKGLPYKAPSQRAVDDFVQCLASRGIITIIRKSKGQDIDAACGQLAAHISQMA